MKKFWRSFLIFGLLLLLAGFLLFVKHTSPLHAIATGLDKIKANQGSLYDSVTGKVFIPRGTNYVRLAQTSEGSVYVSTFEPGQYNLAAVQSFLNQMQHDGYNTVRISIDSGSFTPPYHGISEQVNSRNPIYGPYIDNVASFVEEAAKRGIYVIPIVGNIPATSYTETIHKRYTRGYMLPGKKCGDVIQ